MTKAICKFNFILVLNLDLNDISFHSISHWQSSPTSQFYCDKWYFNQSPYKCRRMIRCLTACAQYANPQYANNHKLTLIHDMTDLPAINELCFHHGVFTPITKLHRLRLRVRNRVRSRMGICIFFMPLGFEQNSEKNFDYIWTFWFLKLCVQNLDLNSHLD